MRKQFSIQLLLSFFFLLCAPLCFSTQVTPDWDSAIENSRGQTVNWYMWGGSPPVNRYVNGYLAKELKNRFDITLRQVPVNDIGEVVSKLLVEKQAGKIEDGSVDLIWINGENFRTCKKLELLFGPFALELPNQKFVDWTNPSIKNDFGTAVDGMESPWGSAQFVMIYDSERTATPPQSIPTLLDWIEANPGRFTYPAPPDFTGSAFIRHLYYHFSGSVEKWQGQYSDDEMEKGAAATFNALKRIKKSLWRQGTTYPDSPVRLNSLFADGEVDFTFSYNQGEASRNIIDGLFPNSIRSFVFEEGTLANTHFVAIPFNAAQKGAAMVVANFLLSPEAQLKKADVEVWGDGPAVTTTKLPKKWQQAFAELQKGIATLSDKELQSHQLPEPPSKILIALEKGWDTHVLKNR
jgi:putative spermidine/putrescine transport system substrate-binding protein